MYVFLFALGLLGSALLWRKGGRGARIAALCGFGATPLLFVAMSLWGDALWFDSLGYGSRFWRLFMLQAITMAAGAGAIGFAIRWIFSPYAEVSPWARWGPVGGAALVGALWGAYAWDEVALLLARVATDVHEPFFGWTTGFYLFVLPFLGKLFELGLATLGTAFAALGAVLPIPRGDEEAEAVLPRLSALGAGTLAFGCGLGSIHLLFSNWGVVSGPGWVDAHVRLPAYLLAAGLFVAVACLGHVAVARHWVPRLPGFEQRTAEPLPRFASLWCGAAGAAVILLGVAPLLVQWLVVKPNEISFERPYLAHNIAFTQRGFRLHTAEEQQFPAAETLTPDTISRSQDLLGEIRLWDQRALDAVYKQFQEIRLYYEFHDVDMDRYRIGDRYRQVMVSAREMEHRNLPETSRTFVNQRFKYTHGYGVTIAPVHDFTPDGLPNLLVKDLPPQTREDALRITRPEIYYGELTHQPAVVRTLEPEFDYPKGDENVYTRYEGSGGVPLQSLLRKFVFGWKLDGTLFFFSSYPREEARIMMHRSIRERAKVLAPFLEFDPDPYIVVAEGRLFWIVDAYTTSSHYPYSEPFDGSEEIEYRDGDDASRTVSATTELLAGANYVRNSVKVVVDAYHGTTDFYVFEPDDPMIRAWQRVVPSLFKPASEMPAALRTHVRYPETFLLTQGLVYSKYHMDDPEVFYNQEDLWVRATEKYRSDLQPVRPYYVMWKPPGSTEPEFGLILPFTPKNRHVMIGWIAGLCDGDHYGRFVAYKFPKEKRVLGPQQVETKIDQDRYLSAQLTLWDQRGSQVIRGNTLAIPLEDALLYLQPIYLQAETAAYPELRLVVAMHGDRMRYGETFREAMAKLLGTGEEGLGTADAHTLSASTAPRRAREAFAKYLAAQGKGEFRDAAEALEDLAGALDALAPNPQTPANGDAGLEGLGTPLSATLEGRRGGS